jgi:hypothetical protein
MGGDETAQKGEAEVSRARCVCVCKKGRVRVERRRPEIQEASARHAIHGTSPPVVRSGAFASWSLAWTRAKVAAPMRPSLFHFSICDPTKRFPPTCRSQRFASAQRTTSPLDTSTAFTPFFQHTTLTTATMIIFKVRSGLSSLRSYPAPPYSTPGAAVSCCQGGQIVASHALLILCCRTSSPTTRSSLTRTTSRRSTALRTRPTAGRSPLVESLSVRFSAPRWSQPRAISTDRGTDTGANASAEEAEEGADDNLEQVIDVVHSFRLNLTGFDKKGYLTYLKGRCDSHGRTLWY